MTWVVFVTFLKDLVVGLISYLVIKIRFKIRQAEGGQLDGWSWIESDFDIRLCANRTFFTSLPPKLN